MGTMHLRWALGLAALISGASCKRIETGVREQFARKFSCPEERVAVTARPDLSYGSLVTDGQASVAPSPEVAKDPERLARWTADQASQRSELTRRTSHIEIFDVAGCDHTVREGCARVTSNHGSGASEISCTEIPPR